MASATIDIFYKFQQAGVSVAEKIKKDLEGIKVPESKVNVNLENLNNVEKAIKSIPEQLRRSFKDVEKSVASFADVFEDKFGSKTDGLKHKLDIMFDDTAEKLTDSVSGRADVSVDKIKKDLVVPVENIIFQRAARLSVAVGSIFGAAFAPDLLAKRYVLALKDVEDELRGALPGMMADVSLFLKQSLKLDESLIAALRVPGAIIKDTFQYVTKGAGEVQQLLYNNIKELTSSIRIFIIEFAGVWSKAFSTLRLETTKLFISTFKIINESTLKTLVEGLTLTRLSLTIKAFLSNLYSSPEVLRLVSLLQGLSATFLKFVSFFYIFRVIKDSMSTFKAIIFGSYNLLTPLEHASRLVSAISAGMFHIYSSVRFTANLMNTAILGVLASAIGGIGLFTGLFTKTFQTFTYFFANRIQQNFAKLGSVRARILIAISFIRDSLYKISTIAGPMLDSYIGKTGEIEKNIKKLGGSTSKAINTSGAKNLLSMTKLPIMVQFQLFRQDFMNLITLATQKIAYIAGLIEAKLTGAKINVDAIANSSRRLVNDATKGSDRILAALDPNKTVLANKEMEEQNKIKKQAVKEGEKHNKLMQKIIELAKIENIEKINLLNTTKEINNLAVKKVNSQDKLTDKKSIEKIINLNPNDIKPVRSYITAFVNSMEASLRKEFDKKHFDKSFGTIMNKLFQGKMLTPQSSKDQINRAFSTLQRQIEEGANKLNITGNIGQKFAKILTVGMKENASNEAKIAASFIFASFQNVLLSGMGQLNKSGKEIIQQIAGGMATNKKALPKNLGQLLEEMTRLLPKSPAKEGPLVNLRKMGAAIIDQLTLGLFSKAISIKNALASIFTTVQASIMNILDTKRIADRVGTNVNTLRQLEYAFAGFDIKAQDLAFTFTSIGKAANSMITPENNAALLNAGISFNQIRNSADPMLETMYQLSDMLQRFPIDSLVAQRAFEALGIMANTNLVNALKTGRSEIQKMMLESQKMGGQFGMEFLALGEKFNGTMNRLKKLGDYLEAEIIAVFLPTLNALLEDGIKLVDENIIAVRSFIRVLGETLSEIFNMIKRLYNIAKVNPSTVVDFAARITNAVVRTVDTIFWAFMDDFATGLSGKILVIVLASTAAGLKSIWYYIKNFGVELVKLFSLWFLPMIFEKVIGTIRGFVNDIESKFTGRFKVAFIAAGGGPFLDMLNLINTKLQPIQKGIKASIDKFGIRPDFTKALIKSVDEANVAVEEAKKTIAEYSKQVSDPKTMEETKNRIKEVINDIEKTFGTAVKGTPFEDTLKTSMENIKKAISSDNFDKVKKELEELQKKAVDTAKNIEKEAVKVPKNIVKKSVLSMKEIQAATLKLNQSVADINIRTADNEADREQAQHEKNMIDLQIRHKEEQEQFLLNLQTKYGYQRSEAEKSHAYLAFIGKQIQEANKMEADNWKKAWETALTGLQTSFSNVSSMFGDLYELSKEQTKEFFYAMKAAAIAETIINTIKGVMNAVAMGPWGVAQAATIAAMGTVQVAKITAQTLGFQEGGIVPGSGSGDIVPAKLEPNEFVQPKNAVNYYGTNFMEAIRKQLIPKEAVTGLASGISNPYKIPKVAYQTGGIVANNSGNKDKNAVNLINFVDPNMLENYLRSNKGKNTLFNVMRNDQNEFKKIMVE